MAPMAKQEAYETMLRHHTLLAEQLDDRVKAVRSAVADATCNSESGDAVAPGSRRAMGFRTRAPGYMPAVAELAAFLAEEVLTHAQAEEESIYPVAASLPGLAGVIDGMIEGHRKLSSLARELDGIEDGAGAVGKADEIAGLFAGHACEENDIVLPPLLDNESVDLTGLLAEMHRLTEQARVLDVRRLVPAERHEAIFAAYEALAPAEGFVLVNDHDPKPLYYQFQVEYAGQFTWDYLESGPRTWRVRIGRPPA